MIEKVFNLDCYEEGFKAIVFCESRQGVDTVYNKITEMGFNCSRYHSDMTWEDKDEQYKKFIEGKNKVLISTDMMARGIDIVTIALVVNYDLPLTKDNTEQLVVSPITYVHRTGRAGRFGRKCVALSIVSEGKDAERMDQIKKYVGEKFQKDLFKDVELDSLESIVNEQLKEQKADTEVEKENAEAMKKEMDGREEVKPFKKDNAKKPNDTADKKNEVNEAEIKFE